MQVVVGSQAVQVVVGLESVEVVVDLEAVEVVVGLEAVATVCFRRHCRMSRCTPDLCGQRGDTKR